MGTLKTSPKTQGPERQRPWLKRGIRALLWLLALSVCITFYGRWHLENRGLPSWIKERIIAQLAEKGWDVSFGSMRWLPDEGLVIEDSRIVLQGKTPGTVTAETMVLNIQPWAWLTSAFELDHAVLKNGRFEMPLGEDGVAPWVIDDITSRIQLHSRDWWELDILEAEAFGAQWTLSGSITNAMALRNISLPKDSTKASDRSMADILQQIVSLRQRLTFGDPPELKMHLDLDASELEHSSAHIEWSIGPTRADAWQWDRIRFDADLPVKTPSQDWAFSWQVSADRLTSADDLSVDIQLGGEVTVDATQLQLTKGSWRGEVKPSEESSLSGEPLHLEGMFLAPSQEQPQWELSGNLQAGPMQWEKLYSMTWDQLNATVELVLDPGNWRDGKLHCNLSMNELITPWVSLKEGTVSVDVEPHVNPPQPEEMQDWAWWTYLSPYHIQVESQFEGLEGELLEAQSLASRLRWQAPNLQMEKLSGALYEGGMDLKGLIHVPSRLAKVEGNADFDARRIRHLLSENGRRWIDQYTWEVPPKLQAQASATLPMWTDSNPDWRGEVKPTMALEAQFQVGKAAFRDVPVESASSDIRFESMEWTLPNLVVHRPEGPTHLHYQCDARTQDYHWVVQSVAQPKVLRPMLHPKAQKVIDELVFEDPISIEGEIWGRWRDRERTRGHAIIETGRGSYRGQEWLSLTTQGSYTNRLLHLKDPKLVRAEGEASAEGLLIDTKERFMSLTHAVGRIDPMAIAKAIGPQTARTLAPYRFAKAPQISMQGTIPFGRALETHLQFEIEGGPFSYWKFNVPHIAGIIDWQGENFHIRELKSDFYEGKLDGGIRLKLKEGGGATMAFDARVEEVDLNPFMKDVVDPSREAEGSLSGELNITSAETADWGSWQGFGHAKLEAGRLWDTPLFGIFSRLMNAVSPGLGNSQGSDGQGQFTIEDSVIRTQDLSLQERTARLAYDGSVDFEGKLQARVEAELLRDTPMVGKFFSLALWPVSKLFEYKVEGSLGKPDIQPLYMLPKYMLLPFQSLNRIESLVPQELLTAPSWFPSRESRPEEETSPGSLAEPAQSP